MDGFGFTYEFRSVVATFKKSYYDSTGPPLTKIKLLTKRRPGCYVMRVQSSPGKCNAMCTFFGRRNQLLEVLFPLHSSSSSSSSPIQWDGFTKEIYNLHNNSNTHGYLSWAARAKLFNSKAFFPPLTSQLFVAFHRFMLTWVRCCCCWWWFW